MASVLFLLAAIEAGFNSYSLNSNSVGQDAGVSSMLTLRLYSKALSPAEVPRSSLRVLSFLFFLSPRFRYARSTYSRLVNQPSNESSRRLVSSDPFSFSDSPLPASLFLSGAASSFVDSWEANDPLFFEK